jgi:hypothetical protein
MNEEQKSMLNALLDDLSANDVLRGIADILSSTAVTKDDETYITDLRKFANSHDAETI